MRVNLKAIGALCLALVTLPALADEVIGIQDGDTLTVLRDKRPVRIRLADIDAPEKKQAFGQAAKQSLSDLCFGKSATYTVQTTDKYGRTVARVTCDEVDVNRAQIERGLAWVYEMYNKDPSLLMVQARARAGRKGLWADPAPVPPWRFRHGGKGAQTAARRVSGDATCYVGPRGGHYRIVGGHKRYGC